MRSLCYIGPRMGHELLYIMQVGFWIELPVQRRFCPIFVKLWILVNGTQRCGIKLHDIHKHSAD